MEKIYFIKKPLITEKSLLNAQRGKYTFLVNIVSTKREIQKAINELFKVNVISVKTITLKGKERRGGKKRTVSYTSPKKKAIVTLKEGEKIDLFESGGNK